VKRLLGLSAALVMSLACLAGVAPQGRNQALVFRKYVVMDQEGFHTEALRLLVPKDWQFRGGVTWDWRQVPPAAEVAFTVSSPDGRAVAEQFPEEAFFWTTDPNLQYSLASSGKKTLQPMPPAQFLKAVWAPHHRAGATGLTVLESQPLPELATRLREAAQYQMQVFGQISPFQFRYEIRTDAAHVKLQYQRDGATVIEDATAAITYFISYMPSMYGTVQEVAWTPSVFSFRAPAGEMSDKVKLFKVIADSRQDNPAWQLSCTRLSATVTREQIRQQNAIFARMQQIHRTQQETSDIIMSSYRERSAAYDRIFDNYSQAVRGVETYVDPTTSSKIELPNGYTDAWTNGTDYVMSNDPRFNPNVGSNQNWQRLNRQK
jgi:hypothetical protein